MEYLGNPYPEEKWSVRKSPDASFLLSDSSIQRLSPTVEGEDLFLLKGVFVKILQMWVETEVYETKYNRPTYLQKQSYKEKTKSQKKIWSFLAFIRSIRNTSF